MIVRADVIEIGVVVRLGAVRHRAVPERQDAFLTDLHCWGVVTNRGA